jgi:hypothetical protein
VIRPRSGSRARRSVASAFVAAALLVLAACSSVPTTGPIEQGPVVDSGESTQFIRVIAAPPSTGATPEQVVRGFLEANASLEDDHGIARRYLTPDAAASWAPGHRTTVYSVSSLDVVPGDEAVTTPVGTRVRTSIDVVGDLLDDGSLQTVDPARPRRIVMTLEKAPQPESNLPPEWRIADPPNELLVSDTDLRRAFREQQVFFLAESSQTLVPDTRLLPVVGPTVATALAERVLAGPSAWLAPGVEPSTPEGTALAFGSVPVADGLATVELTDRALAASPEQRRALSAALTWTLTQLPDVSAVEVLVAGGPYQVPGVSAVMDRATWQSIAPDHALLGPAGSDVPAAFVLRKDRVQRITDAGETSIPLPPEVVGKLSGLSVSLDERRASLIDTRGRVLWLFQFDNRSGARPFPVSGSGSGSFAPDGSFWFTDKGNLRRVSQGGTETAVPVVGAPPRGIDLVRIARDGVRVAVVADGRLLVGVVQHDADGAPTVASLHRIVGDLTQVRDVSWRTATDLDVLGSLSKTGRQLVRIGVGSGNAQGLRAPTGTWDVAAAPSATTLAVAADRIVYENVGLQWRQQAPGDSAAYPG